MNALSRPLPETVTDRRDRQLAYFRRAADQAARAMDIASEQLESAHASGEPGATASPTLDFARASRALVLIVNAENRCVAGQPVQRAPANDVRRPLLREVLHKAVELEPDPKIRRAMHRDVDSRIEDTLLADPDSEIELFHHVGAIADEFHLEIDITTVRDVIIGLKPNIYPEPGSNGPPRVTSSDTGDPFY